MPNAVVVAYARSPFTLAFKGALASLRPDDLLAQLVKGLLTKVPVNPAEIEDLIVGCAFPEGEQGYNIARMVGLNADLPRGVAGATINRWCGSSMQAVHMAAGAIALGSGSLFIAAGVESMSRVPMMGFNPMPNPALAEREPGAYLPMGLTAENLADAYGVSRAEQEIYAVGSHRKAATAQAGGGFADEIVPIRLLDGTEVDRDGCVRADATVEALATLKPAFRSDGSVTAGTSSPLTDGAAALLIASEEYAKARGLPCLARIRATAVSGCDPAFMGIGPVSATRKALKRATIAVGDLSVIESNEAFAVQAMAVARELGFDDGRVNRDGGALALGHPLGATGARIVGKAASLLARDGGAFALATQCIGGGQGIATVLEAL
ncbi:thiolase family protein [Azospirillum griseum]|uniref:Thiolase family protein n=1 Tax=Azospirillum griseum TaxID=2496639 RepID=A0A3S0K715_9PROT|nr:thiolase family protein [Azospirillum griseum]RTR13038.1 thiolase family protein [Azospirillum griseum]